MTCVKFFFNFSGKKHQLVTLSVKLFSTLTIGFRGENVKSSLYREKKKIRLKHGLTSCECIKRNYFEFGLVVREILFILNKIFGDNEQHKTDRDSQ